MKVNRLILLALIAVAGLNLVSCGPKLATDVVVHQVPSMEVKSSKGTQEVPLPNCAGSAELTYTLESIATVQQNVDVSSTAVDTNGVSFSIPEVAKVDLENKVESTYETAFQVSTQQTNSITMKAAANSYVAYVIEWHDQVYQSTMDFKYGGKPYETNYTYTLSLPQIQGSASQPCTPTGSPAPTPISTLDVRTPEGFLRQYFSLVTDGQDYGLAWSMLTPKFRKVNDPGGYSDYVDFWKTIEQVDLNNIVINPLSNTSVNCQLNATFHTRSGITDTEVLNYRLIYDTGKQTWMFDQP
ncbi:MAG TPA: hypothetical protein VLX61_14860 [Anaerolineales bacterium]|nr:hypothetical protein [Anaerolineales bacterium]